MSFSAVLGTGTRTLALATLVLSGLAAVPGTAAADDSPGSAVSQYVEMIPTAGGSVAAGSAGKAKSALKPAAKEKLKRVSPSVAKQLDSVATSPAYGAPADPPASSATAKPVTQKPVTQKAPTKVVAAAKKVDGPAKTEAAKPRPVFSEPIPPAPTLGSTGSAVLLGISDQGSLGFLLLTLVVGSGIAALATTIQRRRI